MTQEPAPGNRAHPGKASTKNINHALKELRSIIEKEEIASIALPRLATGVGGMEWSDVEPLIKKYLGDLKIPVIIYETYNKGEKATENLSNTA
jgi:O-acetyl-ADP-ribose deacetylase (regulator of RNase III)